MILTRGGPLQNKLMNITHPCSCRHHFCHREFSKVSSIDSIHSPCPSFTSPSELGSPSPTSSDFLPSLWNSKFILHHVKLALPYPSPQNYLFDN